MSAKTAVWYDSMYNNRALVPDHAHHFALWAESSAQARASHKCQLNIAYGTGPNESLDIFLQVGPMRLCLCSSTEAIGAAWTKQTTLL